jgi:hypothetical protein
VAVSAARREGFPELLAKAERTLFSEAGDGALEVLKPAVVDAALAAGELA